MADIIEELKAAVLELPELYQPLFGHDVTGIKPQRICTDRLADIKKVYDAMSQKLNRPLRVLDLGCNLGFFSLYAAKWGGVVTGVDIGSNNLRVCKLLASEHPNFKIEFIEAKLEEFIPKIKPEEYDFVLCFNVLHWITLPYGLEFTKKLVKELSTKIGTGIFELATKSEFPNNNLPNNYRDLMQGYSFIRSLSYYVRDTKKNIRRPFLFVSNEYVYLNTVGLLKIDEITYPPGGEGGSITYYHCGDKFIKCRHILNQLENEKSLREINFLKEFSGKNHLPKFYEATKEYDESGLRFFIAREKLKGISLFKKIENHENFDRWSVIKQALQYVIFLEKHGYYQSDFHLGNFLLTDDGQLYLIDYEYMVKESSSSFWPYNFKMNFFNFMNEVFATSVTEIFHGNKNRFQNHTSGKMLTAFHKYVSDEQYEKILQLKDNENFFEELYEILFTAPKNIPNTIAEIEILEIEKYLDELGIKVQENTKKLDILLRMLISQQQRIEQLEKIIKEKLK
ncbi:MAG: methyltransferase domain-containing protein [Selenomonadaceae bacterium]|nr:methyltransferase domain-containing protein [Selenomonadaceae bacterium]